MDTTTKIVAAMLTETITRDNIDALLDAHRLEIYSYTTKKWYSIRRNGKTKHWKRNPNRIRIPCKVGFRECFAITEDTFYGERLTLKHFRIKP